MSITAGLVQSPAQAAIVTLLKANATLLAIIPDIYDAVPAGTTKDFIAVGEWTENSEDTLEDNNAGIGSDCTVTVHVYTDDAKGNAGYKKGQSAASRIKVLLHESTLTIAGWTCVACQHEGTVALRDEDETGRPKRHLISTYRIVAEAT